MKLSSIKRFPLGYLGCRQSELTNIFQVTRATLSIGLLSTALQAQTSYPMITRVEPTAIRRGETAEVTITGVGSFAGANALVFEGTGHSGEVQTGEVAPAPPATKKGMGRGKSLAAIKTKITVTDNAAPGPHELRVFTTQGVSSVGLVVVVDEPVMTELDDVANDKPATATAITLPVVVTGAIAKVEDVDWYRFEAQAGQTLVFSIWGNRLENKIHDLQTHLDPILTLYDSAGRELAVDDNHDFADPLLIYTCKDSGVYRLQIRDTTYAGNANWTYVLQATAGPYATSVFPLGVNPGSKAELRAGGANLDPLERITLDVAADQVPGPCLFRLPTSRGMTLPTPLVVTKLRVDLEENDTSSKVTEAQQLTLPVALCGRLGETNDVDVYRFDAKKGQIYAFEVVARRAGAAIDPVIKVLGKEGQTLTQADDTFGKDPRLEWNAPDDGAYAIEVTDLHSRGGVEYGYVLLAEAAKPDFVVTTDPDKLNLGPGARTPLFVKVERRAGFVGPVTFNLKGLPPGVQASSLTIVPKMKEGVIVVEASAAAEPSASLLTLIAEAKTSEGMITREATPTQEIYMPGGGRSNLAVATMPLGITAPSDITVEATPSKISLKPGESATIDVTVTRHGDYDKPVNLAVQFVHLERVFTNTLPNGVSFKAAGSKTLLGPTETTGKIVLQAAANAEPIEDVAVTVMGHVSINFMVKTAYCSAPIGVTVLPK